MTIQKIQIECGNKTYDVILEDGVVYYIDPSEPLKTKQVRRVPDAKVTSLEEARRLVLKTIKREDTPGMTFSD